MLPLAAWIPIAFLLGSIPFGLIISKAKGIDIRAHGSGNIGATNVGRVLGKKWGMLCFALDALKGFAPVLAAGLLASPTMLVGEFMMPLHQSAQWLAVMLAAVLGHVFSPWLKFKGGKGVATGVGAMLGIMPALAIPAGLCFVCWLILFRITRTVSVASIAAAFSLPAWVIAQFVLITLNQRAMPGTESPMMLALPFVLIAVALVGLVVYTHRANIARLRAGKELKFTGPKSP
jgi:acyl phosphate:glycerol-3-phosphate acyltransferase